MYLRSIHLNIWCAFLLHACRPNTLFLSTSQLESMLTVLTVHAVQWRYSLAKAGGGTNDEIWNSNNKVVHNSHTVCLATKMARSLSEGLQQHEYRTCPLCHTMMLKRHIHMKHMITSQHEAMVYDCADMSIPLCLHKQ